MIKFLASFLLVAFAVSATDAEKEVLGALDLWRQAVIKKDRALFDRVLSPDLVYAHSSGLVETKEQSIQHIVGSKVVYDGVDLKDTVVRIHGQTAIVTGKVDYRQSSNGKSSTINLGMLTVWTKGPGGWQMLARQATRLGSPQ